MSQHRKKKAAAAESRLQAGNHGGPDFGKFVGDVALLLPVIEFLDASERANGLGKRVSLIGATSKSLVPKSPTARTYAQVHRC
jgi:hypothetical protein